VLPTITPCPDETEPGSVRVAAASARRYYRPSVGPRDTRSPLRPTRQGRAWRPEPSPAVPATVPVWSGANAWLASLGEALKSTRGDELRSAAHVRVDTVLDVAAVDARAADSRTGRNVSTAHETVAAELGCCAKTVQRARVLIEALGYALTEAVGRYLTAEERAAAAGVHGQQQRRMASHRALTLPRPQQDVHLPRRGQSFSSGTSRSGLPKCALTRAEAAPRPAAKKRVPRKCLDRPSLSVQRLAAALVQRLPWLAGTHIWALCRTLSALGIDDTGWTAQDLIDMLDHRNVDLGLYSIPGSSQRAPLALFAHQVRSAVPADVEPPRARRRREAEAAAAERARQQAERAALEAQLAAERDDPEVQARIAATKARMREHLAEARMRSRWRH